jgi:hypothetical protein
MCIAGVGVPFRVQGAAGESFSPFRVNRNTSEQEHDVDQRGLALTAVVGGAQVFLPLWGASCAFLAANVWVLVTVMRRYR